MGYCSTLKRNDLFSLCGGWLIVSIWVNNTQLNWFSINLGVEDPLWEGLSSQWYKKVNEERKMGSVASRSSSLLFHCGHCLLASCINLSAFHRRPFSLLIQTGIRHHTELQAWTEPLDPPCTGSLFYLNLWVAVVDQSYKFLYLMYLVLYLFL